MAELLSPLDESKLTPQDFVKLSPRVPWDGSPSPERPSLRGWRIFKANRLALSCSILLAVIALCSAAVSLSPYDPDYMDLQAKMAPPSWSHWLGTDELGRDSLTRVLYGGRVSLMVGFSAMAVSLLLGSMIGAVSGWAGGRIDGTLMRCVDLFQSVPSLLMIIVIYAFIPANTITLIFMLALFSWPSVARIVRAQCLTLKERDFVAAAQILGLSQGRIILRHLLPNMAPQMIVAASLSVAGAILDESALSFLGYGVKLPQSSWGSMLQNAQQYILYDPLLALVPGLFILLTVLCFNVLGDALQQALDPRLRR